MTKSQKLSRRRAVALGLGTFASVGVWPGLSKFNEYNKQAQLLAARKDGNFTVVGSNALKERAAAKKLIYGAATGYSDLRSEVKFATSFRQECAMLMAEGDLLWCAIRPSPSDYDFTRAD